MERSEKVDLYKSLLKRDVVYITFLAAGETDLALLPEPVTLTDKLMYKLCKEKADAIKAAKFQPADSEHPEGTLKPEESEKETQKEETKKKTSARRTTKKN